MTAQSIYDIDIEKRADDMKQVSAESMRDIGKVVCRWRLKQVCLLIVYAIAMMEFLEDCQ